MLLASVLAWVGLEARCAGCQPALRCACLCSRLLVSRPSHPCTMQVLAAPACTAAEQLEQLEVLGELMRQSHVSYSCCGLGSGDSARQRETVSGRAFNAAFMPLHSPCFKAGGGAFAWQACQVGPGRDRRQAVPGLGAAMLAPRTAASRAATPLHLRYCLPRTTHSCGWYKAGLQLCCRRAAVE